MKLSPETIAILKNFAHINEGIYFKKGNIISTMSPHKNILADATISEKIPTDFGIFDLNNFLSVNSLFKEGSELEFDSSHVIIKGMSGRSEIKYRITDPSMIVVAPAKRPNLPSVDVKFTFTKEDFDWVIKTATVLGAPHLAVESDGTTVRLITFDESNDASHTNSLEMSEVDSDGKVFKLVFKTENLKVIPDTYSVEISSKGISTWTSTTNEIKYWITLETSSKFGS
jgi:uncharacterized protein YegJ (DUF2314 family)